MKAKKVKVRKASRAAVRRKKPVVLRARAKRRARKTDAKTPVKALEPVVQATNNDNDPPSRPASDAGQGSMLHLYLREIGQVKLLTPQEEIQLAKRIKRGDEQARELMIKANLRLVVKIARDYENLGLPLLDLINEGNIGLMKGVERFDPKKGAKLSTYASWWIKQSIRRALANQSKTIRLPSHVIDKLAEIRRTEVKLKETLDRDPTDEELASTLGLKAKRIREYREAAKAPIPLEAPLGNDDDSDSVSEVVADTRAAAPFENALKASDAALMKEVFATLNPREQRILSLRFGLVDDTPRTLEEIGVEYGLTRERIRQIEAEGLKKLRARMSKRDVAGGGVLALVE